MANNFSDIQAGAVQLIETIKAEVKSLDTEIGTLNKNVKTLLNAGGGNSNQITQQIKTLEAEITKLNSAFVKQEAQIKRLTNVRTQSNKATSEEVVNQRALRKASDLEAQSKSKIVGAYQRLNAQRNIAKKKLQDLIIAKGKDNSLTKKAQAEYDRYTNKINQANKATSNFSKTGLGSAVKGLKNLVMAFGVVGGVQLFASMAKDIFELTKKLDGLNFAMRKIIPSNFEFQQTLGFLKDITNAYGTEIVATTERYIKFLAAAKQSNLSLTATEKIFGTVTKASGVLGLKTDELTGVYLALEQMLSKGKVTTEELRRQLGERLPGAFGIMADAVGVTVSELDKMLKAGEILSADALPKFAAALEVAYGIESVTKVDTLVAAQNRLKNAWIEFVDDLNASKVFKDTLNFLAENLTRILNIGFKLVKGFIAYKAVVITLSTLTRGYTILVGALASAKIILAGGIGRATIAMRAFNLVTKANPIGILISVLGLAVGAWVAFKDGVIETSQALKALEKQMFEVSKAVVESELKILDAKTERIKNQVKNEKEANKETLKLLDEYEGEVLAGTIGLYSTQEELDKESARRRLGLFEEAEVRENEYLDRLGRIRKTASDDQQIETDNALGKQVLSYEEAAKKIEKTGSKFRLPSPGENDPVVNTPLDNAQIELLAEIERRRKALRDIINKQISDEEKKLAEKRRKDAFELAKALLKIEIAKQKDIMDNTENSLSERLIANTKYLDKTKELINLQADFETKTPEITSFKVKQIEAEKQDELTRLTQEGLDNRDEIIKSDFKKQVDFYKRIKDAAETNLDSELAAYQNKLIKQGLTREEIEKKVSEREKEIRKENLKNFLNNELTKLKAITVTAENRQMLAAEIAKLEMMLSDLSLPDKLNKDIEQMTNRLRNYFQSFKDEAMSNFGFDTLNELMTMEGDVTTFDKLLEKAKETGTEFEFMFNTITEVGQEAFNFLQQNQQAYFDTQFSNLEKERDIAIAFAGDSATAREEIERQYEDKRRQIQQKQAKAEKEQAMFNIAVNTAQAIVSTLAQAKGGAIAKGVQAAIIGGLGAAQLALVASQPLPEFFRGTANAPEGWAMVDEKRPEVHTDRVGNIKSFGESKANQRWMSAGDKVYTSHEEYFKKELGGVLEQNDILPYKEAISSSMPIINVNGGIKKEDFVREIRGMRKDIMSKETSVTNIDKNGFYTGVRKQGAVRERQNSILKLKGGVV